MVFLKISFEIVIKIGLVNKWNSDAKIRDNNFKFEI